MIQITLKQKCYCSIVFLLLIVPMVYAQDSQPSSIKILEPTDGSQVGMIGESILFQSTVAIGNEDFPVLFIKDPLGSWWPYLTARAISQDRTQWRVDSVQFGEDRDRGLYFKIQIVILSEQVLSEGIRVGEQQTYIDGGESIKSRAFRILRSEHSIASNIVKVVRE